MVWETFCIVFIWVVIIHFYPKSYNNIGVLSLFSEKSCKSTKQDIMWRIKDMKIEVQWFLEGIWTQYKVKTIHLKFQGITRRKNTWKSVKNCRIRVRGAASYTLAHGTMRLCAPSHAHYAWTRAMSVFWLFSKPFLEEKSYSHSLNPQVIMHYINRTLCTLFYGFIKLEVQGKGQASRASRKRISILFLFFLGYIYLLFCNDVGCYEKLNFFD